MQDTKRTVYTGDDLRRMRIERDLSLKEFWGRIGYTLSRGSSYELGKTEIPEHARRLVYLHYVLGIPTDPDSPDGRSFTEKLDQQHPIRVNNVVKLVQRGIDIMQNTLTELKQ